MRKLLLLTGLIAAMYGDMPAYAGVDLEAVQTCVEQRSQDGSAPQCVQLSHAECRTFPEDAPAAATLCFNKAHEQWSNGIAARMEVIRTSVDDTVSAIAGIEVKYDLLTSLLQCDRIEELSLLQSGRSEQILLQKSRCAALATGYVYIRLLQRSRDLP